MTIPDPTQFTSLARALDPFKYRTNLLIMLATVLGGAAAGLLTLINGGDLGAGIQAGIYTGAAIFIAWVISRDIDPDYAYSAFVAAAFAFVLSPAPVTLLGMAALVVLLRIITRIVGPAAKITDSVVALVCIAGACLTGYWQAGVVGAIGFAMDATLARPLRHQWIFAALSLMATGVAVLANQTTGFISATPIIYIATGITAVVFVYIIATSRTFKSGCDMASYPLEPLRLQAAMTLCLVTGVLSLWGGPAGVLAVLPVWCAMAGISLYRGLVMAKVIRA